MNLDFAALSGSASAAPECKSWRQVGTVGTQALMRVPASRRVGDRQGTNGDKRATTPRHIGMAAGTAGFPPAPCTQLSPPCPHAPEAGRLNEINVSPVSPFVPAAAGKNASAEDFDREAFEERAAIMEFDGGMTRADAEVAALALRGLAA